LPVLRFVVDEDLDVAIVRGLSRRLPELDIVDVRTVGLRSVDDRDILEWAARENRVVLTHDVNTMVGFADARVRNGRHHAGLIKVPQRLAIGRAVEDLVYIARAASADDLRDQVLHLPL
jgi:predicted nuclease of predicted toxin-antitoxin system